MHCPLNFDSNPFHAKVHDSQRATLSQMADWARWQYPYSWCSKIFCNEKESGPGVEQTGEWERLFSSAAY